MSANTAEALRIMEILPEYEQELALNLLKEVLNAWRVKNEIPNEETLAAMRNVQKGVNLSREFHSVAELMEDLNADDPI